MSLAILAQAILAQGMYVGRALLPSIEENTNMNSVAIIIPFALVTHAHGKALKVETLEDLMVTRTVHVEDKLVDLNETQYPIFD